MARIGAVTAAPIDHDHQVVCGGAPGGTIDRCYGDSLGSTGRRMVQATGAGLVERFWLIPDNPPPNPGCFVLPSYALKDRFVPTKPTRAEIDLACDWWRRFPQATLIMATGDNQGLGVPNAAVMADYALSKGVRREHIIQEDRSRNTFENLRYSMELIETRGLGTPTLVTLDLYTRRVVATARRLGWKQFYWLSAFSEGEPAYGWKRLQTRSRATILGYEIGAFLFSKAIGWA
jgi:hypothetical protein